MNKMTDINSIIFELITEDRKYLVYSSGMVNQIGLDDKPIKETKCIVINKLPIFLSRLAQR